MIVIVVKDLCIQIKISLLLKAFQHIQANDFTKGPLKLALRDVTVTLTHL